MSAKAFVDTNLFVYLYSDSDITKREQVIKTLNRYERHISTQVLNEFCSVCLRKLSLPVASVRRAVTEITDTCNLATLNASDVILALELHEKYRYSYYDSLILASALASECKYLLSEDMADRQVVEDRLSIVNIFSDNNITYQ